MVSVVFQKLMVKWKLWSACALLIFIINILYLVSQLSSSHEKLSLLSEEEKRKIHFERGVDPSHRIHALLNVSKTFICTDQSKTIQLSEFNDDYCDCQDGSDEPGTNACNNGRFFCLVEQKYLPSYYVNDGICDCCDGSDEWNININDLAFIIPKEYPSKRFVPCPMVCGN